MKSSCIVILCAAVTVAAAFSFAVLDGANAAHAQAESGTPAPLAQNWQ